MLKKGFALFALAAVLMLTLGAVMAQDNVVQLPEVSPFEVTGDIVTAGSSTVGPLTERMIEVFNNEGFAGEISNTQIGSGAGFERFCEAGETDISNASRAIKDSEIESCKAIGRTPIEFRVGTDALAITVSVENDFLTNVTFAELQMIFGSAETWADVNPDWPAEPIQLFIPGTDSGTFDFFVEEIFDEDETAILGAEPEMSEDDNFLVTGIQGSPYAIGFFGYAYYLENQDTLKILDVEGVTPTAETAESGAYPLARPLFIYSDATIMAEKPQVAAFINFYLTHVNEQIVDVGYFPASDLALNTARAAFLTGMGETVELPEVSAFEVTGDIVTAGSSTVGPLTERMIEVFNNEGFAGEISNTQIGSGAGFERFCEAGETDISNASRAIKDSEIESCKAIGRTPIEFRVGTDALAITVSVENDFLTNVTFAELQMIFGGAETWADVNPDWPAEPIQLFIPGTDSGTFDFFVEEIFDEDETAILGAEPEMSEDDNFLVTGIQGSPYAIGFFGYAYYLENQDTLKILDVEGVTPTAETAESGAYPLARPLFIYSDATIMAEKPQVAAFINYYLTNVNEQIVDVGYFPASDLALNTARAAWITAVGE